MIQELLKIASENSECEEKLAFVYKAMETPGEFTQELNEDIVYLLEEVEEKLEKVGFDLSSITGTLGNLAGKAKPYASAAGLGAAGIIGSSLVNDMYASARTAVTRNRNYEKMLHADPELKEYPAEKVKAYFNTLHEKGGPEMSGDPLIASAFVKQQLELPPQFLLEQVHKLVGTRANIDKSKGSGSFDFSRMMRGGKSDSTSSLPDQPVNKDPYLY